MKKIILCILSVFFIHQLSAQKTKKFFIYIETESAVVFKDGSYDWKPEIPYKQFVRLVTEVFEVPEKTYESEFRFQIYEFLMKNYLEDFKKLKFHKEYMRLMTFEYVADNPNSVSNYTQLFKKDPRDSWHFENIIIKGFQFNPNGPKEATPLFLKAEKLMVKGIE